MPQEPLPDSFTHARQLEKEEDIKTAFVMYQRLLKQSKRNIPILTRLMILSRKQKMYPKELTYLHQIIKIREDHYKKNRKVNSQAKALSEKLNASLGYTDKKGNPTITPEEIGKLQKRKFTIEKKLQTAGKK